MKSTAKQFPYDLPLRRLLLVWLIGGALGWVLLAARDADAHTLPPCTGWPAPPMASIGQPPDRGVPVIIDMVIRQEFCAHGLLSTSNAYIGSVDIVQPSIGSQASVSAGADRAAHLIP